MREHLRRRPHLEPLESVCLLSGASAAVAVAAAVTTPTPAAHKITLTGTAKGTYREVVKNPDTGKVFTFFGSGQFTSLGRFDVTGHIDSPGFVAKGHSTGLLVLSDPKGSLTLSLTGPVQNGTTPVPDVFSFKITNASGKFKHDTGSGYIDLVLKPAATPTPVTAASASIVTHGSFTMTFLTVPPPTTPTA